MTAVINTADQRSVEKRNKALKRQSLLADEGIKAILANDNGRAYLAELVRESQALLPIVGAAAEGAMFREGRKVLGLKILADVQRAAPKQFAGLVEAVIADPTESKEANERNEPDSE